MKKEIKFLSKLEKFKQSKLLKIGRWVMLIAGFFMVFIAPRQFSTVPSYVFWIGAILLAGFAGTVLGISYLEYYLREAQKSRKARREAIILGIAIVVITVAVFVGIKFSDLPQKLFPGYYRQL